MAQHHYVEADRYRLVVSRACPWASHAVIVRRLLGIEQLQQAVLDRYPDYSEGITVPAVVDVPTGKG
jgi:putative glutathione S-transferase